MFDWNVLVFVWLLVAALCAGFGWTAGAWLFETVKNGRRKP